MRRTLSTGKLPPDLLRELLGDAPALPEEVLLGPSIGEDACAIAVGAGTLVAATDPITLTGSDVGGHAVIINANDVAVMGVRPRWFLAAVLLPVGSVEADVRALFASMRRALDATGAALVGGHTEVTEAVTRPIVVGQMLGHTAGRFVSTGGAREGDLVVQVGSAPVEAAAVLAAEADTHLSGVSKALRARAADAVRDPGISVVAAALAAAECGATALHDPTEGGLASGLHEIAEASSLGIVLEADCVAWFEPGVALCEALGADPWGALASGALLATFPAEVAVAAQRSLRAVLSPTRCPVRVMGRVVAGAGVHHIDGRPLPRFDRDEVARVLGESGQEA